MLKKFQKLSNIDYRDNLYYEYYDSKEGLNSYINFAVKKYTGGDYLYSLLNAPTIYDVQAPILVSDSKICLNQAENITLENIQITGENVKWYNSIDGKVSLPLSTVLEDGMYYATQTQGPCESKERTVLTVSCDLSVSAYEEQNDFVKTYPNPVENYLNIKSDLATILSYEIINLQGAVVQNKSINQNDMIDFGSIPSGIYFVKLYSDQSIILKRVIKK